MPALDTPTTMTAPIVGGTPDDPADAPYVARPLDATRIGRAANLGFRELDKDRKFFEMACEEFAGPWYRKTHLPGARLWYEKRPINLLSQMVEIYLSNLVGSTHRVRLKPKALGKRGHALVRSRQLNQKAEKMNLHKIHRRVVQDMLLGGIGYFFSGLRAGSDLYSVDGEMKDPGEWFVTRVSPGDVTRDPDSRDPDEDQFIGHRYRFNRQAALDTGVGKKDVIMALADLGTGADAKDQTAPAANRSAATDRLNDLVEAWHMVLWDGTRTLQCVIGGDLASSCKFIIEPHEYEGPERGPYEMMYLTEMNNQTSPIPVAARLMDLHQALANAGTMAVDQILETDRKLVVKPEGKELANDLDNRMKRTILGDPELAKEFTRGGMLPQMMPGIELLLGLAANEGLSLQQTGGSQSAAGSATEASILAGRASVMLTSAKGKVNTALGNVYRRGSCWLDRDEITTAVYGERLPGGSSLELRWDPAMRDMDYSEFDYDIEIEDTDAIDPNMEKVRTLELMSKLPGIVAGIAQTMGNPAAAIRILSDSFNKPELDEIWTNPEAMAAEQAIQAQTAQPSPPVGATDAKEQPDDQRQSDYSASVRA